MSQVNWDAFGTGDVDPHQAVHEQLIGYMETGHHGAARALLKEHAEQYPEMAETLRLSLVRKYGTGL